MFHDFVHKLERWKIRWALVDDKQERLLDTICNKPGPITGYIIQHHQYLTDNVGVIGMKREICQFNERHEFLLTVDYWRYTTIQLIT